MKIQGRIAALAATVLAVAAGGCTHGKAVQGGDGAARAAAARPDAPVLRRFAAVMVDNHSYPFSRDQPKDCKKQFLTRSVHIGPDTRTKDPSVVVWSVVNSCEDFSEKQKSEHGLGACKTMAVRFAKWSYFEDEQVQDGAAASVKASDLFSRCMAADLAGGTPQELKVGDDVTVYGLGMGAATTVLCTVRKEEAGRHPRRGEYGYVVQLLACDDPNKIIDNRDPVLVYP